MLAKFPGVESERTISQFKKGKGNFCVVFTHWNLKKLGQPNFFKFQCHARQSPQKLIITERFHSRGQHLWTYSGAKEIVCIRKEFNSHRTGLGHQHGRSFIVLKHQYGRRDVMWKRKSLNKNGRDQVLWACETEHPQQTHVFTKPLVSQTWFRSLLSKAFLWKHSIDKLCLISS